MTQEEISTLWSEIITQQGLQTAIDLISNPPKILSSWIEGPISKDGQQKIWHRKLLFSSSPFPEVVRICKYSVSSRLEIAYHDKSISSENEYELELKMAQDKADEKLKAAGFIFE